MPGAGPQGPGSNRRAETRAGTRGHGAGAAPLSKGSFSRGTMAFPPPGSGPTDRPTGQPPEGPRPAERFGAAARDTRAQPRLRDPETRRWNEASASRVGWERSGGHAGSSGDYRERPREEEEEEVGGTRGRPSRETTSLLSTYSLLPTKDHPACGAQWLQSPADAWPSPAALPLSSQGGTQSLSTLATQKMNKKQEFLPFLKPAFQRCSKSYSDPHQLCDIKKIY